MIFPGKLNLHLRLEETCSHTLEMVEVFILSFVCRCFCHCFILFLSFQFWSVILCHVFCHVTFGLSFLLAICLSMFLSFEFWYVILFVISLKFFVYVCMCVWKNIKNYKKIQNMTTKWQINDNASRKMCFCNLQICICLSFVVKLCHFFRTYHQNDKKYNKMANK